MHGLWAEETTMNIPLKLKYRTSKPKGFKSRTNNKGEGKVETSLTPRRVAYGPFWWIKWNSQALVKGDKVDVVPIV